MENKEFHYTYKAPTEAQRREIANIRQQYCADGNIESKLERLRRLDARVKNLSATIPLIIGIVGCLTFGLGLTMILQWTLPVPGILTATVGALIMLPAYPVYRYILQYCKKKYGAEILRLSDELLGDGTNEKS